MQPTNSKPEPVFDLIKSMTKAEKRNFKLYATRLSGNQDAKFLNLFDVFDSMDEYEEARVLKKSPVKKEQLPNMKAHLYKQILISIRLLNVQHNIGMQIREQIDFARILYDKGHYRQSQKYLEKAKEMALANQQHTIALEITEFQKVIENLHISRSMVHNTIKLSKEAGRLGETISNSNELSNLSSILYSLYLKLGYIRSERDLDLINRTFLPVLNKYRDKEKKISFYEKVYYYQAVVWYNYIQHDFVACYRYARKWINLFDSRPAMKEIMYDNYLKGVSRLLDGLFLMNQYGRYIRTVDKLEAAGEEICGLNRNAELLYQMVYYYGKLNQYFLEGDFAQGTALVPEIEVFLQRYDGLDLHHRMLYYYKIACLYFGNEDYKKCMAYLQKVISTRDPQVRRDLQCYARILNLIASYEAGIDYNIDYQIKAVYSFLVKMNDMHEVQKEMISFLKRLNTIYHADFKKELTLLYERLLPYTTHPYERRTFFYLDIIAWLESKIRNIPVSQVVRERFKKMK